MANYYGTTRSEDFMVNDKEKAELILSSVQTDGEMYYNVDETDREGIFKCWFGSTGSIYGIAKNYSDTSREDSDEYCDDDEADFDFMVEELQSILLDGEVLKIVDVGYEKLRYVGGGCVVATKHTYKYIDILHEAEKLAKEMLEEDSKDFI